MRFLDRIIEEIEDVSDFFYDAYREVKDWIWPFYLLKYPFYGIYGRFHWLADWFGDFNEWVDDTVDRLRDIIDEWDVWDFFRWWFDAAEDAWNWVRYAWDNVIDIVGDWWASILPIVKGYIDTAVEGLNDLIEAWDTFWTITFPEWTGKLDNLKGEWDNFWIVTFPYLVSFDWLGIWWDARLLDINSLIENWTLTLAPFWEGWQEWRDQVIEFFSDPYQWIYDRLDEFFERFW